MTKAAISASPAEIETRYFYTDHLAAAWMAKHFGMRFVGYGPTDTDNHDLKIASHYGMGLFDEGDRIAVHLTAGLSLTLGDLVFIERRIFVVIPSPNSDPLKATCVCPPRNVPMICLNDIPPVSVVIIQRNGTPFHWLESEPA